ncbi:terminase large subunit domain-containing protein [Marinobacter sp. X15-166B]|uniref:terminase large subunit domain-containing protein n=1 Tax=Marinobacter sp. X15-166B TaxID=1897620 RepID=UPI00085BF87D|nr:terminase family protein [Marinobacter sp. X15-166B]OEY67474.1 terminase [Marinobacter sp. X15-166B]
MDKTVESDYREHFVEARTLYWMGWRAVRICERLGISTQLFHAWKKRFNWDDAGPIQRVESSLEARMVRLIFKDEKEGKDFKEIDLLGRQIERLARVHKYSDTGRESDLNPNIIERNKAPRKAKNDIGEEGLELITSAFEESLFDYQHAWKVAGLTHRIRNILKSRQIGATWYFAREAIVDAFHTGKNKIFLSASKAQAHIFRQYIVQFIKDTCDVELKGDPLVLPNGATLYFLGTNARTAQGYHGDLYMDEYFWIHDFQQFRKVASGMAMHKKWSQTYFSTPSAITHDAHPFWTGDLFNRRRAKDKRIIVDTSHAALAGGLACEDGQWRQIVTIEDAMAGGCDLFDIDQLRLEFSDDEFANLLMCQFVDDTHAVFPLVKLQQCMVDSWIAWRDLKPYTDRPLGNSPVWIGYDPSGSGENSDGAGLAVISPSKSVAKPHRVIEKIRLRGLDYEQQAEEIRKLTHRYNVEFIGIDSTGLGEAVAELVEKFFPAVTRFHYSLDVKARLVLKTQNLIDRGRLQFDSGDTDIAQSFMAIRRVMTDSQKNITYAAGRGGDVGHSDIAWAIMHALANEPLEGPTQHGGSMMEIY